MASQIRTDTIGGTSSPPTTTPPGRAIPGLYATGWTAIGICANSYVNGLSLSDCVVSRRVCYRP